MQTIEPLLSEHPFFMGMPSQQIQVIAGCGSNAVFNAGQYLFHEGEEANSFYLIRHGKIDLEAGSKNSARITIQTADEGDVVGWSWLIAPYRWHFDAKARELTRVVALDGKCLRGKCDDDHQLGYEIMQRFSKLIAQRIEATRFQLLDVYGG
jgi:CRP/FNR family transcriptional regulator, cyclic AMP receptor protein